MRILSLIFIVSILSADNSGSLIKATAALNAGMFEEALVHINKAQINILTIIVFFINEKGYKVVAIHTKALPLIS